MQKYFLSFVLCGLLYFTAKAQKDEAAIRSVLKTQETAWNSGDLRGFMKGYWENDSLVFIGRKGPTYGYNPTLDNYLRSYPDTTHMGHFTSEIVSVHKLSPRYYLVIGKWTLERSIGNVGGYYTLLFRKIRGQWVIVLDHTS